MHFTIRPLPITIMQTPKCLWTAFMNYGETYLSPAVAWFIEGADKNIIVDTGITGEGVRHYRTYPCTDVNSFEGALAKVGLTPEKIDIVIQTHLHYDHCFNTAKCVNARVIVQESELKYAYSPHTLHSHTYFPELFKNSRLVPVEGDAEIVEGISVLHTPGHSPGGQSVVIDTDQGKAIITGFCSIWDNFRPSEQIKGYMPVIPAWLYYDLYQWFDSAMKVKGMADIIIPTHDEGTVRLDYIPAKLGPATP
jgi:N-acyl homoserine lactone hydrolase